MVCKARASLRSPARQGWRPCPPGTLLTGQGLPSSSGPAPRAPRATDSARAWVWLCPGHACVWRSRACGASLAQGCQAAGCALPRCAPPAMALCSLLAWPLGTHPVAPRAPAAAPPSTGSGYAGAGGPCLPHVSACVSACGCVCARLCRVWGKAWGQQLSLGPAGAGGLPGPQAPHTAPCQRWRQGRGTQAGPCPRHGLEWSLARGVQVRGAPEREHTASSWPGTATGAQCRG